MNIDSQDRRIIFLFAIGIILALFSSCKSKQVHRTKVRQSDTLIVKKEVIKAPILNHSLTIHEICDSITGEVVRFEKIFVVDGDSIQLLTDANNTLKLQIKARERTLSEKNSEVSRVRKELLEASRVVRYRIDWSWTLGAFVVGFVVGLTKPWRYLL